VSGVLKSILKPKLLVVGQIAKAKMLGKVKIKDLPNLIGIEMEPSAWVKITQNRVNLFAEATNDFQFIHVNPERAAKTDFGGPIVHGFLLLSLLPELNSQHSITPENLLMSINYGSDKVRYLTPVHVGKRIRSLQKIIDVKQKQSDRWLIKKDIKVEIEGEEKLALIAEMLQMLIVKP